MCVCVDIRRKKRNDQHVPLLYRRVVFPLFRPWSNDEMVNKRRSRSLEFERIPLSFCLSVSRMRSNFSNSKEEKKTSYHNTYTRALCYLSGGSFRGVPKRIPTYIIAGGRVIKLGFEKKRKHGKNRRLHDARVHRGVHIPRLAGGVLSHGCVVVVVVVFVFGLLLKNFDGSKGN